MSITFPEIHNKSWQGTFCKLMKSGKTVQAMRVLDPDYQSGRVLKLSEKINGKTVRDILKEKHPRAAGIVNEPGVILEQSNYFTDIGTNITEGMGLLGSFIGIDSFVYKNVSKNISKWMTIIERLAEIAISDPQVAYCAYVFSLQHRWTHLIRTCKCKGEWFNDLEDILSTNVLTSITGLREISDLRRFIFQLPIKHDGLGLVSNSIRDWHSKESSYRRPALEKCQNDLRRNRIRYSSWPFALPSLFSAMGVIGCVIAILNDII
ncbi:hypothetical protein GJ496_011912 [Pomphorhynchus laevis]|nr:hypothetical protein GJ496_011912 [Pomphorhynchus laevis]